MAPETAKSRTEMTPERWQQLRELLAPALEMGTAERTAYLDQIQDALLRNDLKRLLAAEKDAGTEFLDSHDIAAQFCSSTVSSGGWIGRRIGPYKIVEEIGAGGMGTVYQAIRADDQYQKRVAIKLLRSAFPGNADLARFKAERQILANLEHPNVTRLLDGGTTDEGLPYLVMELVEGQPIEQYCDAHKLPIAERLGLFRSVCSAVQYAHQNLIVHRDLKPGNILVTAEGVPKLLDFGIAKILDPAVFPGIREFTTGFMRVLTPEYASPEQVRGETITTASDVYSLGVLLYVLLTGHHPYALESHSPQHVAKAVCDHEPPKPSAVIRHSENVIRADGSQSTLTPESVSSARSVRLEKLERQLAGDLDNILLMSLRKEPRRRYASVEQFSRDIKRHLEKLPVVARGDSLGYRTAKFFSRNKAGIAAVAAVILTLLLGMALTLREARIARAQQARAERHFNDIRELSNSLMFDIHDSIQDLPGSTPARKMLVDRSLKYLDRLTSESRGDASLQSELAAAYEKLAAVQGNPAEGNLGDLQSAAVSYRKAAEIWESVVKANPDSVPGVMGLARTYRQLSMIVANSGAGDFSQAMRKFAEASGRLESFVSMDTQVAEELVLDYRYLGNIEISGDPEAALRSFRKALSIIEQRLNGSPKDPLVPGAIKRKMSEAWAALNARDEALECSRQALKILGPFAKDPTNAMARGRLADVETTQGDVLLMNGNSAGALQSYRRAQAGLERLVAADPQNAEVHVMLAYATASVGHALSWEGNAEAAMLMFSKAMRIVEPMARNLQHLEARHVLARSHIWAGELLIRRRRTSEALGYFREGAAEFLAQVKQFPEDRHFPAALAASHNKIGDLLAKMGRSGDAAAEYRNAVEIAKPLAIAEPRTPLPWYSVADAYFGLGELSRIAAQRSAEHAETRRQQWSEARGWYQQSVDAWRHIPNPGAVSTAGFTVGNPRQAALSLALCDTQLARLMRGEVADRDFSGVPSSSRH